MRNLSDTIFKIAAGLFFSSLYLGVSFLASYLSIYWKLWSPVYAWFTVGFIIYAILLENKDGKNSVNAIIGILSIIGMYIYHAVAGTVLRPWVYIVVNSIVCLNIIVTCIRNWD